jgi:hypothetical protein
MTWGERKGQKYKSAARYSRALVTEEANKEPQPQVPAVTPPWQPPPNPSLCFFRSSCLHSAEKGENVSSFADYFRFFLYLAINH